MPTLVQSRPLICERDDGPDSDLWAHSGQRYNVTESQYVTLQPQHRHWTARLHVWCCTFKQKQHPPVTSLLSRDIVPVDLYNPHNRQSSRRLIIWVNKTNNQLSQRFIVWTRGRLINRWLGHFINNIWGLDLAPEETDGYSPSTQHTVRLHHLITADLSTTLPWLSRLHCRFHGEPANQSMIGLFQIPIWFLYRPLKTHIGRPLIWTHWHFSFQK